MSSQKSNVKCINENECMSYKHVYEHGGARIRADLKAVALTARTRTVRMVSGTYVKLILMHC